MIALAFITTPAKHTNAILLIPISGISNRSIIIVITTSKVACLIEQNVSVTLFSFAFKLNIIFPLMTNRVQ